MKQTRQPVCAIKQSIYLDVYGQAKASKATVFQGIMAVATVSYVFVASIRSRE